jgi:Cu(I)/Ag(I) efflux system membrane protein CusA/SilA
MGIGIYVAATAAWRVGAVVFAVGLYHLAESRIPERVKRWISNGTLWVIALIVTLLLTEFWLPLGPERGSLRNFIFVAAIIGTLLGLFLLYRRVYGFLLIWCLGHKVAFLSVPLCITFLGALIWLGFDALFGWVPGPVRETRPLSAIARIFPGPGREFMPPLDEGSYFYMPTVMPHASIAEAYDTLQKQDMAIITIPEIESVVGKLGRAESPLDPAPISMFETVINYRQEYLTDRDGRRLRFRFDPDERDFFRNELGVPVPALDGKPYVVRGRFARDEEGKLIPDSKGIPFRVWRPSLDPELNPDREPAAGIRRPDDIWDQIVKAAEMPGATSAPKLQPIAARVVMLQSGMRAPMGVKIRGPDLRTIEQVGFQIEQYLKEVASVEPATVVADRIVGKPYIEIEIDRPAIARYGIRLQQVQDVIEVAVGGRQITTTVEGRERYPVRVRYLRELRDDIESLRRILVPGPGENIHIPLVQLADIRYVRGPQMIRAEDTFLVGYVIFDKKAGYAEVDTVEQAQGYLSGKIASGEWELPAGVSYAFAGSYENQVRAQQTLSIVLPLALFIIFMILYLQFHSALTTFMVFSGILVAWSGGFLMIWLYGQSWFLDFSVFGVSMRELFQVHTINLSVAVWVGFLALFGIATDDGVLMATYLDESFRSRRPGTVQEVREAVHAGAMRRIRPALMTSATTILALIPVLTSTGRGADIMVPMAIPSFGGMLIANITVLVVPVLYCAREERNLSVVKNST